MGRLSDARKKARKGPGGAGKDGSGGEKSAASNPRSAEVSAPAAAAAGAGSEAIERASASLPRSASDKSKRAPKAPGMLPGSGLADEILAGIDDISEDVPAAPPRPGALPSSGLADEILAGVDEQFDEAPAAAAAPKGLPSSGLADEILAGVDNLPEDVPAAPRRPGTLPSSGLADEILAGVEAENAMADHGAPGALPGSGLADDILSALSAPVVPPSPDIGSLSDEVLAAFDDGAWSRTSAPASLPSSGLADEILSGHTTGVDFDDIRSFSAFFEEEKASERLQIVLFKVGKETFGLEIQHIQEIIRPPAITRVPNASRHVRGVFNLRGKIVPVFDLRILLTLAPRELDSSSRVMVVNIQQKSVGVLIDRVVEVAYIDLPDIEPPPEELAHGERNLISGVARHADSMIFMLDAGRILAARSAVHS
jgi:purine-binding chemotaxis protein CheW